MTRDSKHLSKLFGMSRKLERRCLAGERHSLRLELGKWQQGICLDFQLVRWKECLSEIDTFIIVGTLTANTDSLRHSVTPSATALSRIDLTEVATDPETRCTCRHHSVIASTATEAATGRRTATTGHTTAEAAYFIAEIVVASAGQSHFASALAVAAEKQVASEQTVVAWQVKTVEEIAGQTATFVMAVEIGHSVMQMHCHSETRRQSTAEPHQRPDLVEHLETDW